MSEIIIIEQLTPAQIFNEGKLDDILNKIEAETRPILIDISTKKGREDCAFLAHKIAKSKTFIDKSGKYLVSGWKEQAKVIDRERARSWDRLEALQHEIRKPLTDWENAEKERIATHESNLAEIINGGKYTLENWQAMPLEIMQERLSEVENEAVNTDWQEFKARADIEIAKAIENIAASIKKRESYDAEQAELKRLREEQSAREQKEREEKIAAEAAEKAKAESARQIEEAENRAKKAEVERIAAEERTEKEKQEAAEAAARMERERIEAEKEAEAKAIAAREADQAHKREINSEAFAALDEIIRASNNPALAIVEAIASGKIPHIKINY